jgi:hypothetical protein
VMKRSPLVARSILAVTGSFFSATHNDFLIWLLQRN